MPATPDRIASSTVDGVVLTKVDPAIKALHMNAEDMDQEREMFFDDPADAQVLVDELWDWKSAAGRPREAAEVDASLGLGTVVPIAPAVPQFNIIDESRGIDMPAMVRAYAVDHNSDRYSVELAG